MENEIISEIEENIVETETGNEEDLSSSPDIVLPSGSSDITGVPLDPAPDQTEIVLPEEIIGDEGAAAADPVAPDDDPQRTFTEEELEQIVNALLEEEESPDAVMETEESIEAPRTIFNTPLEEYSVSEGLLVCIFLLMLAQLIHALFKGSHWFGRM